MTMANSMAWEGSAQTRVAQEADVGPQSKLEFFHFMVPQTALSSHSA